jgi:hypothetical protein
VVGVFNGRSEFGPRALGFRSILADARNAATKRRLDENVKKRESFMPYAPSVLHDEAGDWFECAQENELMQYAFPARDIARRLAPAALHVDGTARLQVVTPASSPVLYRILRKVRELTGVPLVINTSLNRRGEPIAETPADAIDLLASNSIDALAFHDNVLVAEEAMVFLGELHEVEGEAGPVYQARLVIEAGLNVSELPGTVLKRFPYVDVVVRSELGLRSEYFDWMLQGRKTTTIRCRPGAIDLPDAWRLPVHRTLGARRSGKPDGRVVIGKLELCRYSQLDEVDGQRDGFRGARELMGALEDIYGRIADHTIMTIYHIEPEVR